jgi:hypothetical protein
LNRPGIDAPNHLVERGDRDDMTVMAFTVTGERIVAIDSLGDPDRLSQLDIPGIGD